MLIQLKALLLKLPNYILMSGITEGREHKPVVIEDV